MSLTMLDLAHSINRHFDGLVARQKAAGSAEAARIAEAEAFAAVFFFEQVAGRPAALALIEELRSA